MPLLSAVGPRCSSNGTLSVPSRVHGSIHGERLGFIIHRSKANQCRSTPDRKNVADRTSDSASGSAGSTFS